MTPTAYFDELCKEAGELVFTSVKDVKGSCHRGHGKSQVGKCCGMSMHWRIPMGPAIGRLGIQNSSMWAQARAVS